MSGSNDFELIDLGDLLSEAAGLVPPGSRMAQFIEAIQDVLISDEADFSQLQGFVESLRRQNDPERIRQLLAIARDMGRFHFVEAMIQARDLGLQPLDSITYIKVQAQTVLSSLYGTEWDLIPQEIRGQLLVAYQGGWGQQRVELWGQGNG